MRPYRAPTPRGAIQPALTVWVAWLAVLGVWMLILQPDASTFLPGPFLVVWTLPVVLPLWLGFLIGYKLVDRRLGVMAWWKRNTIATAAAIGPTVLFQLIMFAQRGGLLLGGTMLAAGVLAYLVTAACEPGRRVRAERQG